MNEPFRRAIIVAFLASMAACGDGAPSRPDVMAAFAAEVAVPALEAFSVDAAAVVEHVDVACTQPDDSSIVAAIAAVDEARLGWLATQAMWTGPVMEDRSPGLIDWVVDATAVETLVEEAEPGRITADVIVEVGADTRGLRALRGVLSRGDAQTLLSDERWCDYATSIAAVIEAESIDIVAAWTSSFDGGPAFADVVADPEQTQDWLSMFVNDSIFLARLVTNEPRQQGDVPSPDPAADRTAQLHSVAAVMGALAPLLDSELDARLQTELAAAIDAFEAGDVVRGGELAVEVERTLATDVAGRLDVTIGFSDADGDGSG